MQLDDLFIVSILLACERCDVFDKSIRVAKEWHVLLKFRLPLVKELFQSLACTHVGLGPKRGRWRRQVRYPLFTGHLRLVTLWIHGVPNEEILPLVAVWR